jgi:cell division septation protein DedD
MKLSSKRTPSAPFAGPADAQTATDAPPTAKSKGNARKGSQTPPKPTGASRKATKKEAEPAKAAKTLVKREKKEPAAPREGNKTAMILALLRRQEGAKLTEIMQQAGWQKHSVRGFISSQGKKGVVIRSFKNETGERCYQIAE